MTTTVFSFDESEELKVEVLESPKKTPKREHKGRSLLALPSDYVVLDLETTGLDPRFDSIIEIGIMRVRENEPTERFDLLVKPPTLVSDFITELTGITNQQLENAPDISDALPQALDFIGEDIVIGHNVNFDINFLYDFCEYLNLPFFDRDFIDTMRLSRRLFPELPHHRLIDLIDYFGLTGSPMHRASADIEYTWQCFELMREYCIGNNIKLVSNESLRDILANRPKISGIGTENTEFDTSNPFYGQNVVFTGVLEKLTRQQAAQIVVDLGGHGCDSVTKKTNFLVLGNNDYCTTIKNGKSNKQLKAEKYQLQGLPIQIISENVFYDMINEE